MTPLIRLRPLFVLVIATALCSFALPGASAVHNNQGTIKVHDDETEDPPQRNVPHVDCDFFIEGFNMGDDSGWIVFFSWPPTGDKEEVASGEDQNWTADNSVEHSFHFLAGPFTLATGHWRVEVYTDAGHPGQADGGNPHFAKAKTFWVECGEVTNPPCPPDLNVVASTSGEPRITLTWDAVADADAYVVYRATAGEDFEAIATTDETTFVDDDVTLHVTYQYYVTAVIDDVESVSCEIVEATAIPFFPTWTIGALALVGSLGAFVLLRRRS